MSPYVSDGKKPRPDDAQDTDAGRDTDWDAEPRFSLVEVLLDEQGTPHDYRFLQTSPAFDRHAGVPAAGRTVRSIVPELNPEWPRTFHEIAASGRARRFFRPSEMDGRQLEVSAVPVGPAGSRLVAVTTILAEEPKRVEADLHRAHGLLEGIAGGTEDLIAALAPDFTFTYFNEAYAREFAHLWSQELSTGSDLVKMLDRWPDEQAKAIALWQRALDGESFRIEMSFGPSPEEARTYDLRFSPLHDPSGQVVGAAHIFRDVTDRIRVEEELREADRRKDEFLAMLGHELRNPLAAIRHATQVIKLSDPRNGPLTTATDTLLRQSEQMARLIDGLLEVSRVVGGKIELVREPLDLGAVVREVIEDHGGGIRASGVQLAEPRLEPGVCIEGDRVRVAQIIDNLLVNALRFTESGGSVSMQVSVEGPDAVFRIRDTGAGIPAERLDRIFEAFHQEHRDMSDRQGGLGLGLALARGLAELHGGSLEAHSEGRGRGAEFVLRLPGVLEDASRAEEDAVHTGASGYRILLVEDHTDAAEMLVLLLRAHGHVADTVPTATDALAWLESNDADYVVSDIGLPDMSGYDLARRLRADGRWHDLSLIALTGFGQDSDRDRAAEAGFDLHLTKPVAIEQLDEAMERLGADGSRAPE